MGTEANRLTFAGQITETGAASCRLAHTRPRHRAANARLAMDEMEHLIAT